MKTFLNRIGGILLIIALLPIFVLSQQISKKELLEKVREYRKANEHKIIGEYLEFLSIPNVSEDAANVRRNAEFMVEMMEKRGIDTRLMETAGNPIVFGELNVPGAERTIMFYEHYDGQPVDPSKWVDTEPFKPVLRTSKMEPGTGSPKPVPFPGPGTPYEDDWRIYARSTSDDKAPVTAILAALDALTDAGLKPTSNLKFIFEGEEEASSPNLLPFCEENRELLKTDVLFMCDGPVYFTGDPTVFFGVRGIVGMSITVYGPNANLHSGHYGNWAPNPGMRLAKLLAAMKNEEGHVLIDGFYDTVVPLSEQEKQALARVPSWEDKLKEVHGFIQPEGGGRSLNEMIQLPSLNIRGMKSAWVGEQARTIVPSEATASIDIRLVKGCDPAYMKKTVIDFVKSMGYHVVDSDPDQKTRMKYPFIARINASKGYPAARTSMDLPISKAIIDALTGYYETDPIILPSLGGSLPLYIFTDILELPTVGVPIANFDNNQHQPNENIRIGQYWKGIETFAALMMMK